jgi:urocanate hydratase
MGGVARRNWARNENAMEVAAEYNRKNTNGDQITIPFQVDETLLEGALTQVAHKKT